MCARATHFHMQHVYFATCMFIAVAPMQGPRKPYTEGGTFVQMGLGYMTFLYGDLCVTVLSSLG